MRARLRTLAFAAALTTAAGCHSLRCNARRDAALESQAFGEIGAKSAGDVDLGAFLPLARAAVLRGDLAKVAKPPALVGRRVLLTLRPLHGMPVRASGLGASLEASVLAAADAIAAGNVPKTPFRVELEVMVSDEPLHFDEDPRIDLATLGLDGFALVTKDAQVGWVAPGEVLSLRAFKTGNANLVVRDKLNALLAARAGTDVAGLKSRRAYRFRTQAVVEAKPGEGAIALYREWPVGMPDPTPERLIAAVGAGADYLCRVIDGNGKYVYLYRVAEDRPDPAYGMLRHAGTTYALLEAYEELKNPLYLQKADLAIGFLRPRLKIESDADGSRMAHLVDAWGSTDVREEQQKVGGAGLAMLALAKRYAIRHAEDPGPMLTTTAADADLEELRSLGRLIAHQQYPDGHFRSNADVERETGEHRKVKKEVIYYAGEAILGLLRLYALDPDPRWLDVARKGADYVAKVRDAGLDEEAQEHDHWMSYALNELDRLVPDEAYKAHAWKIARAIRKKQWVTVNAPASDFLGAFYAEAPSTPASTRLEAYDADIKLARHRGEDAAWLVGPAKEMAAFTLAQQFDDARAFAAPDAEKVRGGVRESLFNLDVRIDYVQHAMSGWLHLARLLRDPSYGK
jgi:hypothetical protein